MQICELIPLKTTKKINTLTYFTALNVDAGDLVEINMNGQMLSAIVLSVSDVKNSKSQLRSQDFKIKKIIKIISKNYVSSELLSEIYNLSTLLATTINNIFNSLLPISILSEIDFTQRGNLDLKAEHQESAYHVFATNLELRRYKKINKNNKYILASTPSFKFLEKSSTHKINKIIIHNEHSRYYYSSFKNIDSKKTIIYICKALNIKVEYDNTDLPSLDLYAQYILNKNDNKDNILLKKTDNKDVNIIKMTAGVYLDKMLEENILKAIKKEASSKKILLYTMRKGMYTQSVCGDCASVVKCKTCDKPYVLITKTGTENDAVSKEINYHVCNTCHDKIRLEHILKFTECNSWNIKTFGIGTQGIENYLCELLDKNKIDKKNFEKNIFRIDSDNTKSAARVEKEYCSFLENTDSSQILIATEMLLPILTTETFDIIIIVSVDSAFYLHDYNIDEKLFFIINDLRKSLKSGGKFFIQTRMSQKFIDTTLKLISGTDSDKFYKKELALREKNNLPPYYYILTYESKLSMNTPKFLEEFKKINMKINLDTIKHVFFIPKTVWENRIDLRSLCLENLYHLDLKINSKEIL